MPTSLTCPNCSAPLPSPSQSNQVSVHCDYCNSTIIVPESERPSSHAARSLDAVQEAKVLGQVVHLVHAGSKDDAVNLFCDTFRASQAEAERVIDAIERKETVHFGDTVFAHQIETAVAYSENLESARGLGGCVWRIISLGMLLAVLVVVVGALRGSVPQIDQFIGQISGLVSDDSPSEAELIVQEIEREFWGVERVIEEINPSGRVSITGFAEPNLQIGGTEGTGPGFFNDTRQMDIDGEGLLYAADFDSGRIQIFNRDGEFVRQINVGEDTNISSMVVNRQGVIFLVDFQGIHKFDNQTGERIGTLPNSGDLGFIPGITIAADGSLLAAGKDRLIQFDTDEVVTLEIPNLEEVIPEYDTTMIDTAVDGSGNIYIMGQETIYKLDENGRFLDRIGSRGEAQDQFLSPPTSIIVDGRGYLYAADFFGIKVFDADGSYLTSIPMQGVIFDMVVTTDDQLIVMDRNSNEIRGYDLGELLGSDG